MKSIHAIAAAATILAAAIAGADTIYVCWDGSGDYLTIQEGIDAATDGDEVVVCDGTYTGPGNRDIDFHGKAITVRSADDPEACIIDGQGEWGLFIFWSGETETSVLHGFTIRNGAAAFGGAVECYSDPTIRGCVIRENWAVDGGGILCAGSGATIVDCIITQNTATGRGGGICCAGGAPAIVNCLIVNNDGA